MHSYVLSADALRGTSASMHKGRPHFPALGRVEAAFVKKL